MKDFKKYCMPDATPEEVYNAPTTPIALKLWTNEEGEMRAISVVKTRFFGIFDFASLKPPAISKRL